MIEIDAMTKAFRHCASDNANGCMGCPLCGTDDDHCQHVLFREAADALERLKKENDHMKAIDAKERLAIENAALHEHLIEKGVALKRITAERDAAKTDIAALLWLNGICEYCNFGRQESYSGASRWTCELGPGVDCRPEWRGSQERRTHDSD